MADFPNFLDLHSRTYILNRSQLELELEDIKKRVKTIMTHLNSFESSQLRASDIFLQTKQIKILIIFSYVD
jgi:endonuclease/exonuclease/phosphatase family metal-dependent hydrolase